MSSVPTDLEAAANGTSGWKQEINDRVAAARARRQAGLPVAAAKGDVQPAADSESRAARVAAAVAARYAQAPTYSDYLAAEVRTAMDAAIAAQEAAQKAAEAAHVADVASAQHTRSLQAALELPNAAIEPPPVQQKPTPARKTPAPGPAPIVPRVDYAASGLPYPSASTAAAPGAKQRSAEPYLPSGYVSDPLSEAWIAPATPLPAKLLEFPRELVAARKARPRHAEGPLREDGSEEPQLRIFEVEPEAISTTVEPVPHATEWSSIRLGAHPVAYPSDEAVQSDTDPVSSAYARSPYSSGGVSSGFEHQASRPGAPAGASSYARPEGAALVNVASLEDRLMAGAVDAALVGIAFVLFAFVFAASTVHPPTGRPAIIGSALVITGLYLLYQFLFFTFSSGTPGMLYARIALCTFDDDNPTRQAMRKRIFALVLAAMPLGLGFLYAVFDEDHLGWHDRMTRMYQRSYR